MSISKYLGDVSDLRTKILYERLLNYTQSEMNSLPKVKGERKVYYLSAEFLIGKLLSNNLMNLGIYDEVDEHLKKHGRSLSELEDFEEEPSLGNGGLGRLAACFLDSIATLGINGEGLGLVYHNGLFKQVFSPNNHQLEFPDVWLDKPSWLKKTNFVSKVQIADTTVFGRMYEMDILGYQGEKTVLRLFDLESVDNNLIDGGISFDQHAIERNLTLFLYPDDSTESGQRLRFIQQYFMVKTSLDYILSEYQHDLEDLDKHIVIQINDTHPALAIPMLMKHLLKGGVPYRKAIDVVSNTFAYTNHTILSEALETWPLYYFKSVDSELEEVIKMMDETVRERSKDPFIGIIGYYHIVHMASLAVNFSYSVNGVAKLHSEIIKNTLLNSFYQLYPEKFNNKTNGITFRRWLLFSNKELTSFLDKTIGDDYKVDATKLEKLLDYIDDEDVIQNILDIKDKKKNDLKDFMQRTEGVILDETSIFDIQIKRLHEYKRQQLNLLYIIDLYLRIKGGYQPKRPITFFFGAKAAASYVSAKDIIHTILTLRDLIKQDEEAAQYIDIVFVENYNVTKAEMLIPAADISEQISLASKEASGTGNMKLMLNGALTLGTMDGANVEIRSQVGDDNIYIFGKRSDEVIRLYETAGYHPHEYYGQNPHIRRIVDFIVSEPMRHLGTSENLYRLYYNIKDNDAFMTLLDLEDYIKVKDQMFEDYENRFEWGQKMLVNIATAGYFSSDRTILDYEKEIWKTKI